MKTASPSRRIAASRRWSRRPCSCAGMPTSPTSPRTTPSSRRSSRTGATGRRRRAWPRSGRRWPPCPRGRCPATRRYYPVVRRWSTIRVAHRTYSVPAQLMGHTVEARVHPNVVEVRYRDQVVQTMPRLRKEDAHRIDYRHVIGWLVRKPGAFARYRYREDLYPCLTFRRAYDALVRTHGERADVEYLRILHLAATAGEARVPRRPRPDPRSGGGLRLRRGASAGGPAGVRDSGGAHPAAGSAPSTMRCAREPRHDPRRHAAHRGRSDHDACSRASASRRPRGSWSRGSSHAEQQPALPLLLEVLELEAAGAPGAPDHAPASRVEAAAGEDVRHAR